MSGLDGDWGAALDEQVSGLSVKDKVTSPPPNVSSSVPSVGRGRGHSSQAPPTSVGGLAGAGGKSPSSGSSGGGGGGGDAVPEDGDNSEKVTAADTSLFNHLLRSKLVDSKNAVEVQRNNPNSPLYSVRSFEELHLHADLLKGVYGMGFNRPSKIQEQALPILLSHPPCNLIAQSQSGTGKTAAFVLAMLSRVDLNKHHPQVICLSPTFDLAQQTGNVLTQMAQFLPLKMAFAVRGSRVEARVERTEHIIMGTAGTMLDWVLKKKVVDPKKIKMFVLDEADVMIDQQGQQDQTIRIQRLLPKECQMVLFSATYNEEVMKFAQMVVPDPIIMRLKRNEESLDNIKQFYVACTSEDAKFEALCNLYGVISIGQAMVFCQTKRSASWLAGKMHQEGHAVALVTGESTIDQRIAVLNRYREGKEKLLITTNLCARGIDVEQVTVVVNYDVPVDVHKQPDFETYLHRIGRTGRFGRSGLAINFVDGRRSMETMRKIEEHFGRKIAKMEIDDPEKIELAVAT